MQESKFIAELQEKEATRMSALEEEWRKREKERVSLRVQLDFECQPLSAGFEERASTNRQAWQRMSVDVYRMATTA